MKARRTHRPRPLARLLATTAIGVLVAATVSYAMAGQPTGHVASANVSFTAGSFSSSNSRDGAAIFSARNVRPGSGTSGQVTIANSGQVAGSFSLARSGLSENAGASGGRLSDLAGLAVSDVTRPGAPIPPLRRLPRGDADPPPRRLRSRGGAHLRLHRDAPGRCPRRSGHQRLPVLLAAGRLCVDEHRRGPSGRGSGPPEDDAEPRSPAVVSAVGDAIDSERVRSGSRSLRGAEPR